MVHFLALFCSFFLWPHDDFVKGADVGWLPQMEASGYVFRDENGQPQDCLKILRAHGINTIRLRVFVNPSDNPKSGHCSEKEVVAMAVRARKMGFRILIDFHYSDSWADPGKQNKPAAWKTHSLAQLEQDVHDHTHQVLTSLAQNGVTPEWVQVGNEIPGGMLWPDGKWDQPEQLARLINAGSRAVREVNPKIRVIIHLDRGGYSAQYRHFFDNLEKYHGDYDIIGMSYYDKDYLTNIDELARNMNDMVARYKKEVMIVEIGGPHDQPNETFDKLTSVIAKMRAVPDGKGLGVIYWEPEAEISWSKYKMNCWGADGKPTRALDAFLEQKTPKTPPK